MSSVMYWSRQSRHPNDKYPANNSHCYDLCKNVLLAALFGSKLDSNSLTKTKNWSGRNEVTETSGRLHPLWPQNKWLHTPRTTDYRHTRQDRWIQTELVSTLAKNATKPNPFEIILLQTSRKENNWKTEETLVRAVVTLETDRIKGSNPWCWLLLLLLLLLGSDGNSYTICRQTDTLHNKETLIGQKK